MDHSVYSDLYIKNVDPVKAKEKLCKAIEIFKECGADSWVERTEEKLAAL
jgi:hypothetical protein